MLTDREVRQRTQAAQGRRAQVVGLVGEEGVSAYYSDLARLGIGRSGRPRWQETLARLEAERKARSRYRPRTAATLVTAGAEERDATPSLARVLKTTKTERRSD